MAATTYVLVLEGILAGRDDDVELTQSTLEPLGAALYASLARTGRLLLASRLERRLVDHWCRLNGLTAHAGVVPLNDRVIRRLRSAGETPDLYVDHHPERVAQALKDGVAVMVFAKPLYARSEFQRTELPGLQRPWSAMVAEGAAQSVARARPSFDPDND